MRKLFRLGYYKKKEYRIVDINEVRETGVIRMYKEPRPRQKLNIGLNSYWSFSSLKLLKDNIKSEKKNWTKVNKKLIQELEDIELIRDM